MGQAMLVCGAMLIYVSIGMLLQVWCERLHHLRPKEESAILLLWPLVIVVYLVCEFILAIKRLVNKGN